MYRSRCFTTNAVWVLVLVLSLSGLALAAVPDDVMQPYSMPGIVYDQNTHFQVTESSYLNVSVDSSELVKLTVQSAPDTIELMVEPATSAASTLFTLGGLAPGKAYYKYQDDLRHAEVLTADVNGFISYTQDTTSRHAVHILTHHSTLFLADDATGGDCALIGAWTPETKTCVLAMDLTDTVQIDASGITLDGNGHTITGSGTGYGVLIQGSKSNVTVKNLGITNFTKGIYLLENITSSTVTGNRLYGNQYGVEIWWACYYNVVSNNTFEGNSSWSVHINRYSQLNSIEKNTFSGNNTGVAVIHSYNNYVKDNIIDSSTYDGILIVWACGNSVTGNTISHSSMGLYMTSPGYESWCQTTITQNTFSNNGSGVYVGSMGYYPMYQNNFVDNTVQYQISPYYVTVGHPTFYQEPPIGGNYWSNFDTPGEGCSDSDGNGFCDAPVVLDNGADMYPRVRPYVPNEMPVANAGDDQTVVFSSGPNGAYVTLNGTRSSDPDGDQLTYAWTWDGGTATGASPFVLLPRGTTTVTLTVDDGRGGTSTDTANVNVRYTFSGFLPPVNLGKPFKAGSTIPVKFQITDAGGAVVPGAVANISVVSLLREAPVGDPIAGTSNVPNTGSLFRYDETGQQYIYNLLTSSFSGDIRIIATLDDGTSNTIDIGMK